MEMLNAAVSAVNNVLWSYVLIVVLVGCGLWFTFSTRFVQLRLGAGDAGPVHGHGHLPDRTAAFPAVAQSRLCVAHGVPAPQAE